MASLDGGPKSVCRLKSYVEIGVEWQFDGKRRTSGGHCRQVESVNCACQRYNGVPPI